MEEWIGGRRTHTSQTRIIKLHIPQASLIEHLELLLINLGHVGKVLFVIRIHAFGIGLALLVAHVEPGRGDHGQLDVRPLLLRGELLHQLQLVQVRLALLPVVSQLGARNDTVARHHLAVLLDQADDVRVVEAEHAGLGFLQSDGPFKLVPHQAPEAGAVELAAVDGLEAEFLLEFDDISNRLLFNGGESGLFGGKAPVTDGFAGVEKVLGPQEGPHVFGAEGSHLDLVLGGLWV